MNETERRRLRPRPELWWWLALVVVVPAAILTGTTVLILTAVVVHSPSPITADVRINVAKTGLLVGAGVGLVNLILTGRRQWSSETDATERRITELYTKAADQLGSDKAQVRLAGQAR